MGTLKTWLIKHFGYGRPDEVYFNALYIIHRANKHLFSTDTFSVKKDVLYVYVYVGYDLVFQQRLHSLEQPEVYVWGDWVGDLNNLAVKWSSYEKQFANMW